MAEQKAGGWATPYKYTGKELDDQIGMYDYGARFYDPSISLWTSVDPLTAKYPNYSAYNYVMGNPIRFIDPDGMQVDDIIIPYKGKDYEYKNGKLFLNGNEFTGKQSGFLKKTTKALNKLSTTTYGKNMVDDLSNSNNEIRIEESNLNRYIPNDDGHPGTNIVTNNTYALQIMEEGKKKVPHLPFDQIGDGGTIKWDGSSFLVLGHEMVHAHDGDRGLLDTRYAEFNGGKAEIREIRAVYGTNKMRQELGIKLRKQYVPGQSRLIDKSGNPLNYTNPILKTLFNQFRL
jgi:RHS repeat-associated protein